MFQDLLPNLIYVLVLGLVPPLLAAIVVGIIGGALQSATSIREHAISYGLRLIAVVVTLIFVAPGISRTLINITMLALR